MPDRLLTERYAPIDISNSSSIRHWLYSFCTCWCNSSCQCNGTWSNASLSIQWVRALVLPTGCKVVEDCLLDIVQEISNCAAHYKANLCGSNPVPAMLRQCGAWETCMNRDPTVVGRAKVGAELIAEVINGFVEPISWKTLVRPFS
jgi:hypothetical protein